MTIPTTNEQIARLCEWRPYIEEADYAFDGTNRRHPDRNPGDALAALEGFRSRNPSQVIITAGQHAPWRVCLFLQDGREGVAQGEFCDAVCSAIIAAGEKT
jgi:hypothetical protein